MAPKPSPSLPLTVITNGDVVRLINEVKALEEFMTQATIRKATEAPLPRLSRDLSELVETRSLNLLVADDRQQLLKDLEAIRQQAPQLHFSFAAEPSETFLTKLATWLRQEIHPNALISVGLQPGLGAGCVLMTRNKYFDFSLRQHLASNRQALVESLTQPLANKDAA